MSGYGLLEGPSHPMDRRLRMIRSSPKGRAPVRRIARMVDNPADNEAKARWCEFSRHNFEMMSRLCLA
jgi:hypothetical protein